MTTYQSTTSLAVAGCEQLGGAEDQQCRGEVADLKRADAQHEGP